MSDLNEKVEELKERWITADAIVFDYADNNTDGVVSKEECIKYSKMLEAKLPEDLKMKNLEGLPSAEKCKEEKWEDVESMIQKTRIDLDYENYKSYVEILESVANLADRVDDGEFDSDTQKTTEAPTSDKAASTDAPASNTNGTTDSEAPKSNSTTSNDAPASNTNDATASETPTSDTSSSNDAPASNTNGATASEAPTSDTSTSNDAPASNTNGAAASEAPTSDTSTSNDAPASNANGATASEGPTSDTSTSNDSPPGGDSDTPASVTTIVASTASPGKATTISSNASTNAVDTNTTTFPFTGIASGEASISPMLVFALVMFTFMR